MAQARACLEAVLIGSGVLVIALVLVGLVIAGIVWIMDRAARWLK